MPISVLKDPTATTGSAARLAGPDCCRTQARTSFLSTPLMMGGYRQSGHETVEFHLRDCRTFRRLPESMRRHFLAFRPVQDLPDRRTPCRATNMPRLPAPLVTRENQTDGTKTRNPDAKRRGFPASLSDFRSRCQRGYCALLARAGWHRRRRHLHRRVHRHRSRCRRGCAGGGR